MLISGSGLGLSVGLTSPLSLRCPPALSWPALTAGILTSASVGSSVLVILDNLHICSRPGLHLAQLLLTSTSVYMILTQTPRIQTLVQAIVRRDRARITRYKDTQLAWYQAGTDVFIKISDNINHICSSTGFLITIRKLSDLEGLVQEGTQIVSGIGSRLSLIVETVLITDQGEWSDHVMFWSALTAMLPDVMLSCVVLRDRVLWLMFTSRDNLCVAEPNLNDAKLTWI